MEKQTAINRLKHFKLVAILEGISFLALLFIAMPLKYFADLPKAVTVVGWIHGALFVWYIYALAIVHFTLQWSIIKSGLAFLASLVPFGTFVLDRQLKKDEVALIAS